MNKVRQGAQSFTMGPKNLRFCNIYTQSLAMNLDNSIYKDPLYISSRCALALVQLALLCFMYIPQNWRYKNRFLTWKLSICGQIQSRSSRLAHETCFYSLLYSAVYQIQRGQNYFDPISNLVILA